MTPRDVGVCLDCGREFLRAYDSAITICPTCADRHDDHTTALEMRWRAAAGLNSGDENPRK